MRRILPVLLSALLVPAVASAQSQGANLITVVNLAAATGTDVPSSARGDLMMASDGNFYIASYGGGANRAGAVARITPQGTLTTLHSFASGSEGVQSHAKLVQASDGNLYGTTYLGGDKGAGTVFRVSLTGEFATIHTFDNGRREARQPYTGLVQAGDGNLYGTTMRGGTEDRGTVFRISLSGTLSIVHEFAANEGKDPEGTLIVGPGGELYGTTMTGGENDRGTIYRISTSGQLTTLYSFPSLGAFNADGLATNDAGANPRSALILGADGNFYGTAYQGGTGGYGTVYRMAPAGAVTALHSFTGPKQGGGFPLAAVVRDAAGNLFGTTEKGGYLNRGTAWQVSAAGQFTLLHGFIGGGDDGSTLHAGLTLVGDALYGISYSDSISGKGAVFKLDRGTGGVLPVRFSVSPGTLLVGGSATLTWDTTGAATCAATGAWTDTVQVSGTRTFTPPSAGIFNFVLSCTDGAGVVRRAYASLDVTTPPSQPVDGGGDGGAGSLNLAALLLLGALLWALKFNGRRELA